MAVLEPNSDDKNSDFFVEKDSISEKNLDIKEESHTTNSSEPLTDPIRKKNLKETRHLHMPSIAIGAGIAISCLVLGIFLGNFIGEEKMVEETPTVKITHADVDKVGNPQKTATLSVLLRNGSPILGNINAPLTLVEFGDYQCSFCKRHFDQTHNLIMKNYVETNKVKIVFKDLIATPGKDSMYAAHAAHCAKDQGMFWKYHYMLYNNWEGESTGWVTSDNLNKFAKNIGLDINKFSKCMSEDKWMELINASKDDANALGITGTPSFFLITSWQETDEQPNEIARIHGAQPYDVFKKLIDSQLKK